MAASLLSTTTRVEVPYISVQIGDYSFGLYNRTRDNVLVNGKYYSAIKVTYPNYLQSLVVQKVNGKLNSYTLRLEYQITERDDPDLINKVLSSVSKSRKIIFTYGDCASPAFMYRCEEALITQVTSDVDIASSKITYTINAVSSTMGVQASVRNFPSYSSKKPSEVIKELLADKSSGLSELFYGMHDTEAVAQLGLIPGDDRPVTIQAKTSISVLDYLNYLVENMSSVNDTQNTILKTVRYVLTVHDDTSGILGGPYFKISKIFNSVQASTSIDYYTIDIGYPNKDLVSSFSIDDNEAYAILYDYSQKLNFSDHIYRIGDNGTAQEVYSPAIANSKQQLQMTGIEQNWWSQMTQYPITATLRIKGLLRAAVLMSYIRVNVYFYGRKHSSSGVYIITKQVDEINSSGYSTTLTLVRVQGTEYDN